MSASLELFTLMSDPSLAANVSTDQVPALLAQLVAEQSKLAALQGALVLRLLEPDTNGGGGEGECAMLTVEHAAAQANLSRAYFYDHADRLPFVRRIGRRVLVHEAGFRRW